MTQFRAILEPLVRERVEFIVVGGVALVTRGGSRLTNALDILYSRSRDNVTRIVAALAPLHPRLRGAPADLPFFFDERTIRSGLNFTLTTEVGDVDLFGELAGLGDYGAGLVVSSTVPIFGFDVRVLDLDGLERTKRAAGRAKDLLDIETIEALRRGTSG